MPKRINQVVENFELNRFIKIPSEASSSFWIGKYPVTNAQYERFLKSDDYVNPDYWTGFPKFDKNCKLIGDIGCNLQWLKEYLKNHEYNPAGVWKVQPRFWADPVFGIANLENPVVGVSWYEANAYCKWLMVHWGHLSEVRANPDLKQVMLRLPLETEWIAAAGGDKPAGRYPWDDPCEATTNEGEIIERANVAHEIGHTSPVAKYTNGMSQWFGVIDMAGNVWEWQANWENDHDVRSRGGSWSYGREYACVAMHSNFHPLFRCDSLGFRLLALPQ